jgi:hypothetical protein
MNACDVFRRALEARLRGRPNLGHLTQLGWHEHLLGCGDCRGLLEQEEALELLLASLPEPSLPRALTARVLERLHAADDQAGHDQGLDRLLELDELRVPAGLADRVRAGVRAARTDQGLDVLLERAGQVELPPDLADRVLAGLRSERNLQPRLRLMSASVPGGWRAAAAALIVVGGAGLLWKLSTGERTIEGPAEPSVAQIEPLSGDDERLIVWLPVLEYWDEMRELDPLDAEIVARVDMVDEVLLEEDS